MQVMFLSSSFPREAEAGVDKFLLRRARELTRYASVVVVAPTPWTPAPLGSVNPRWRLYASTPGQRTFDGVQTYYPRYVQLPGQWFSHAAALSMALGTLPLLRCLQRAGRCNVIFAQSMLPDGLTAALLGRWTGIPATCVGRGTDVNVDARRSRLSRRLAGWTLRQSAGVAVVAHDLARALSAIVPMAEPPTILLNGVDLAVFAPRDRATVRVQLGAVPADPLVLYVGRLVEAKGLDDLLHAFARAIKVITHGQLVIAGSGPLEARLKAGAAELGLDSHIRFLGERPQSEIALWMNAADVLVLVSESEGFPNVVRESLASGTPVVATPVGDIPRVVGLQQGVLVPARDRAALADALVKTLKSEWDPSAIRASVSAMTWQQNAIATYEFLRKAIGRVGSRGTA